MPDLKKMAIQGAVKVFHVVRMVVVACVCLLIGFTTRQLFDAYEGTKRECTSNIAIRSDVRGAARRGS